MRDNDLNPEILKRKAKVQSIFEAKSGISKHVAEALDVMTNKLRLAELSEHPSTSVRTAIAQNQNTPFFILFRLLGDDDNVTSVYAGTTLNDLHQRGQIDLSDKGIMKYVLKYEKNNLKAIEAFQDVKDRLGKK